MKKLPRVALLVDTSTSWGRRVLLGVNAYTRAHRPWHLFVEARGLGEKMRIPDGWEGDGVIARIGDLEMARHLKTLNLPVVNVSGIELGDVSFPRVCTDLVASAQMAAGYFIERGFQSFAYFTMRGLQYVATHQRAFEEAISAIGGRCEVFEAAPRVEAEPEWGMNRAGLAEWLESLPKPVAVLTWNASGSREVLHGCQSAGLRVPEEVSVLSASEDDLLCELSPVPISALFVSGETIGNHAAQLLDRSFNGEDVSGARISVAPINVVQRQSTDTLALADPVLVSALSFIRERSREQIQVGDVASHVGVSRRMLERRFLQQLGRSPAEEIRRTHLERAKVLLLETSLPIPEVAEGAGFGSPEYLAQVFRADVGMSPLKFRREVLGR